MLSKEALRDCPFNGPEADYVVGIKAEVALLRRDVKRQKLVIEELVGANMALQEVLDGATKTIKRGLKEEHVTFLKKPIPLEESPDGQ